MVHDFHAKQLSLYQEGQAEMILRVTQNQSEQLQLLMEAQKLLSTAKETDTARLFRDQLQKQQAAQKTTQEALVKSQEEAETKMAHVRKF